MKNQLALYLSFLLITVLASSCNSQPKLKLRWATKGDGVKTPESVYYDKERNVIYVANINENPNEKDGNGFISKLEIENGNVLEERWVTGLNAPKGMGVFGNTLYVSDIDEVVAISIDSGTIINKYKVPGARFLNDITVSELGEVFISDSEVSNIIRIYEGKVEVWSDNKLLSNCNGLYDKGDKIIFATTGDEKLKVIDKKSMKIKIMVDDIGHGDGIASCGADEYLVSDWMGRVFYIDSKKKKTEILNTKSSEINAADIDYITEKNLLIVPTFFKNSVIAYTFTR